MWSRRSGFAPLSSRWTLDVLLIKLSPRIKYYIISLLLFINEFKIASMFSVNNWSRQLGLEPRFPDWTPGVLPRTILASGTLRAHPNYCRMAESEGFEPSELIAKLGRFRGACNRPDSANSPMVGPRGFEPRTLRLKVSCSANWATDPSYSYYNEIKLLWMLLVNQLTVWILYICHNSPYRTY